MTIERKQIKNIEFLEGQGLTSMEKEVIINFSSMCLPRDRMIYMSKEQNANISLVCKEVKTGHNYLFIIEAKKNKDLFAFIQVEFNSTQWKEVSQ